MIFRSILHLLFSLAILGLFYYARLTPVKDRLSPNHKNRYLFFEKLFKPVLSFLQKYFPPSLVGPNTYFDNSPLALLVVLLLLSSFF